jgi:glycosyltransferase involved in cell wall biosynthesis
MCSPFSISVVIPAYNLRSAISGALESVLRQTDPADEIIVIDDGSTDNTASLAEAISRENPVAKIRTLRRSRAGPGAARNAGIQAATNEWIAFLDGDDEWDIEKLAAVRVAMREELDATMIAHDCHVVALDGTIGEAALHRGFDAKRPLFPQLYRLNFLATSAVVVRRKALLDAGGFDASMPVAQDFDLWLKLARSGRLVFIPKPLTRYIERPGSLSRKIAERAVCVTRIAHRHASALVPFVGWRRARWMRLRLVAVGHYIALRQTRLDGRFAEAMRVSLKAPVLLLKALVSPL